MLSAPPGFFLFWGRFWVKAATTPQKLRRNKTKKGHGLYGEIQRGKLGSVPCPEQLIRRLEVKGVFLPTLGWDKHITWLAAGCSRRICGHSPHPLCAVSTRRAQARDGHSYSGPRL